MGKKDTEFDEFDFDDFGSDDDDGGGFDGTFDPPKRSPVTELGGAFTSGLGAGMVNDTTRRKFIKDALPPGYTRGYDAASQTVSSVKDLYDTASSEYGKTMKQVRKGVKNVIPAVGGFMPQRMKQGLEKWASKDVETTRQAYDPDATEMATGVGDIFSAYQAKMGQPTGQSAIPDTALSVKEKINMGAQTAGLMSDMVHAEQNNEQSQILHDIRIAAQSQVAYQDAITINFQRKSLELQYKQFFTARKSLDVQEQLLHMSKKSFEDIVYNTALPDLVKVHKSELAMQQIKMAFLGKMIEPFSNNFGSIGRNIINKGKTKIKTFFTDVGANITNGLDGVSQAGDMMGGGDEDEDSAGKQSITSMLGGVAAGGAGSAAGGKLAQMAAKVVKPWADKHPGVAAGGRLINTTLNNASKTFNNVAGGQESGIGWIDKLTDMMGLRDFVQGRDTTLQTSMVDSLDKAVHFNLQTRKAITDVIPGLLSRILREQQIMRTGDDTTPLTAFSYETGMFETTKHTQAKLKEKLFGASAVSSTRDSMSEAMKLIDPDGTKLTPSARKALQRHIYDLTQSNEEFNPANIINHSTSIEGSSEDTDQIRQVLTEMMEYTDEQLERFGKGAVTDAIAKRHLTSEQLALHEKMDAMSLRVKGAVPDIKGRALQDFEFDGGRNMQEMGISRLVGNTHMLDDRAIRERLLFGDDDFHGPMPNWGNPPGSPPPTGQPTPTPTPAAPPAAPPSNPNPITDPVDPSSPTPPGQPIPAPPLPTPTPTTPLGNNPPPTVIVTINPYAPPTVGAPSPTSPNAAPEAPKPKRRRGGGRPKKPKPGQPTDPVTDVVSQTDENTIEVNADVEITPEGGVEPIVGEAEPTTESPAPAAPKRNFVQRAKDSVMQYGARAAGVAGLLGAASSSFAGTVQSAGDVIMPALHMGDGAIMVLATAGVGLAALVADKFKNRKRKKGGPARVGEVGVAEVEEVDKVTHEHKARKAIIADEADDLIGVIREQNINENFLTTHELLGEILATGGLMGGPTIMDAVKKRLAKIRDGIKGRFAKGKAKFSNAGKSIKEFGGGLISGTWGKIRMGKTAAVDWMGKKVAKVKELFKGKDDGTKGIFGRAKDRVLGAATSAKDKLLGWRNKLMPEYTDVKTGLRVFKMTDITGPVKDKDGNIIVTQEDFDNGVYKSMFKKVKDGLMLLAGDKVRGIKARIMKTLSLPFKMLGAVKDFAFGKVKRLFDKTPDVYCKDDLNTPLLFGRKMKDMGYIDKLTAKPIKDVDGITGPVMDLMGKILISQEQFETGLVSVDGKSIFQKGLAKLKGLKNRLGGLSGNLKSKFSTLFAIGGAVVSLAKDFIFMPKDVYVKGETNPRLLAHVLRAGKYFAKATMTPIFKVGQITGEVVDENGNVVLNHEDLQKGLVDVNGKPFASIAQKLKGAIAKAGRMAIAAVAKVGRGIKAIGRGIKNVIGKVKGFITGKIDPNGEGIFGKSATVKAIDRVYDLLEERMKKPKKAIAGDADGDGDRDGSTKDQTEKRGILAAMKAKMGQPLTKVKEAIKEKASAMKDMFGNLLKSPLAKVLGGAGLGLFVSSMFGKNDEGENRVDPKTGMVIGGAAALALPTLTKMAVKGVAKAGWWAAKQGSKLAWQGIKKAAPTVARFALRTALPAIGEGLLAAGTAIAGVVSAPVLLTAAAIAVVAVGGYMLYKHLSKEKTPIATFRMAQYGYELDDDKEVEKIVELEKLCLGYIQVSKGRPAKIGQGCSIGKALAIFGVDAKQEEDVKKWMHWFQYRFKPVFLSHVSVLFNATASTDLHKIDSTLTKAQKGKHIPAAHFTESKENPYAQKPSPFPGESKVNLDLEDVNDAYSEAMEAVEASKDKTSAEKAAEDLKAKKEKADKEKGFWDNAKQNVLDPVGNALKSAWEGVKSYNKWALDKAIDVTKGILGEGNYQKAVDATSQGIEAVANAFSSEQPSRLDKSAKENQMMVYNAFTKAGFSPAQAKAMTAEVGRENGYQAKYLFGKHTDPKNQVTNQGFFSWQGARRNKLVAYMASKGLLNSNGDMTHTQESLDAQAEFAKMEINSSYKRTRDQFLANPNIDQESAARVLGEDYIRWAINNPKYSASGQKRRREHLASLEKQLGGVDKTATVAAAAMGQPVPVAAATGTGTVLAPAASAPSAAAATAGAGLLTRPANMPASSAVTPVAVSAAVAAKASVTDPAKAAGSGTVLKNTPVAAGTGTVLAKGATGKTPVAKAAAAPTNAAKGGVTPPQMFAAHVSRNAGAKSTGYCARMVSNGLSAAGYYCRKGNANTYIETNLIPGGWKRIEFGSTPQVGDIVHWTGLPHIEKRKYGHIQCWDGTNWVSDFRQNRICPYHDPMGSQPSQWRDPRYMNGLPALSPAQQADAAAQPAIAAVATRAVAAQPQASKVTPSSTSTPSTYQSNTQVDLQRQQQQSSATQAAKDIALIHQQQLEVQKQMANELVEIRKFMMSNMKGKDLSNVTDKPVETKDPIKRIFETEPAPVSLRSY